MSESKRKATHREHHGGRDRDTADARPHKRTHYAAGADGTRDVDASEAEKADRFEPDKDGTGW